MRNAGHVSIIVLVILLIILFIYDIEVAIVSLALSLLGYQAGKFLGYADAIGE